MAYPIKPGLVVKTDYINNESIALPFANRVPHPQWRIQKLVMWTTIRVDVAHKASIFEHHDHFVRNLGWFFVRPKYGFGGPVFCLCPRSHRWLLLAESKIGIRAGAGGRVQYPNSGQISLRRRILNICCSRLPGDLSLKD